MNFQFTLRKRYFFILLLLALFSSKVRSQTLDDAFMMNKTQICMGVFFTHSDWDHYWEGIYRRTNLNLGTVNSNSYSYGGIYGITDKLNILASVPYIFTNASAGTLHGASGLQDLSLGLKYKAVNLKGRAGKLGLYGLAGVSLPTTNYLADYLPLSIGLKSQTLSFRLLGDYQFHKYFFTGSYYYNFRRNIAIPKTAYYTTSLILSDQVQMPNTDGITLRSGFRSTHLVVEAIFQNYTTLGGFDIRTNDNPFPSNRMNWNSLGMNVKYEFKKPLNGFILYGGYNYVFQGRNVGQSKTFDIGLFYAFYISNNHK